MEIAYAFAWYFVFIISATFHEAAHAWAAKKGGDLTAYAGGQVSLNPWPHIKRAPMGMVVIPIISIFLIKWPFGFALTPYDPQWAYNNPRRAAWMSLAGPAANLLLVLGSFIVMEMGIFTGFFTGPDWVSIRQLVESGSGGILHGLSIFISMLFSMNVILFILNLIPLPPLDGSGIISLFLHDDAARKYHSVISNPAFGFIGLLLAWQVFNPIFQALFTKLVNVIYWSTDYYYGSVIFHNLLSF
jgi:Zn-dependent protease